MDELIKKDTIAVEGGLLPIELYLDEDELYYITIDGVEWCSTEAEHHALILFELLRGHVTEYMKYEVLKG